MPTWRGTAIDHATLPERPAAQRLTTHKPQAQRRPTHCRIPFAELDASVQGWINHVRCADTWGPREHVFASHPIRGGA